MSQNRNDADEVMKEVKVIDVLNHEEEENERRAGEAQGISDSHLEKEMPDEDVDVDDNNDADDKDDKDCDDNNNDDCASDDVGSGGNGSGGNDQGKVGGAKRVLVASCDASRTRSRMGKQKRLSYTSYFKDVSDDSGQEGDEKEEEEEEEEKEEEDEKEDVNGEPDHGTNVESSSIFIKKKVPGSSAKNNREAPLSISVDPFCSDVNDFVLEFEMGLLSSNEEDEKGRMKELL
ncbi:serine/threonine-protein kinase rio2-like [Ananas comosus]|uniref:Serine/threonine-protein kinase rio2-like n=1 Tax=Ananas comosus TaxID=4615 RepID=A0A6P5G230_ANACO|nr:serine/threonine-protein kinase rio2-like [Ananas comosus]